MNVIFYLLFLALNFYMLLVLPKRITRKKLVLGLVLSFILLIGLSALIRSYSNLSTDTSRSLAASIGTSVQVIIMLSIMNQFSTFAADHVKAFHEENNQENLHRFPVSWFVQHDEMIKRVFTWFWTIASVGALYWIWFINK